MMESGSEREIHYTPQLYCKRWLMLVLFCLLSFANGAQWSNFPTISDIIESYYNIDSFAVNCLAMVYFIVYGLFVLLSTWLLDKYGLKTNLVVGAAMNASGAWLKFSAINRNGYVLLMLGQTVAAFGQCFTLGIPAHLSAIWFGEHERAVTTSIGVFANQVGVAVGFSLSSYLVPNTTVQEIKSGLFVLFVSQGALSVLILFLFIIFFKEKPTTPPSFSQIPEIQHSTYVSDSFSSTILKLIRNPSYVLLVFCYGFYVSISYAFGTLIDPIVLPKYPGENKVIGNLAFLYIICGLPGAILAGIWLKKTKAYKFTMLAATLLTTIIYAIFTLVLKYYKDIGLLFVVVGFLGFTGTAVFPVGFEYAAELTYPVQEGISSGLLNCFAQIFGVVFVALGTYFLSLEDIGVDVLNWTFTGILGMSFIFMCFVKTKNNRSKADRYRQIVDIVT